MSRYAQLGQDITFEVLTSFEAFHSTTDYRYAEHKVIEARPRLQWIAQELQKISIELQFHVAYTNPSTQMNRLRKAGVDHQARALIYTNGEHRGYFIIEAIEETHQQTADDGSLVAIQVKVDLKEWVPGADWDPAAPAQLGTPAPGIVHKVSGGNPTPTLFPLPPSGGNPVPTLLPTNQPNPITFEIQPNVLTGGQG